MRNECSIIRDILPLYMENMVSADTSSFVEEHLEGCERCRAELEQLKSKNELEQVDSDAQNSDILPIKAFTRKWKRKKAVLVCSTIIATIAVMCCILFAVDHFVYQEKIMVNGAVYTQTGDKITELLAGSIEIGYLRGISHRTTGDPIGNFMATNLDEKYGGCPVYQSEDNDQMIYLEDYKGFYISFALTEYVSQAENDGWVPNG